MPTKLGRNSCKQGAKPALISSLGNLEDLLIDNLEDSPIDNLEDSPTHDPPIPIIDAHKLKEVYFQLDLHWLSMPECSSLCVGSESIDLQCLDATERSTPWHLDLLDKIIKFSPD